MENAERMLNEAERAREYETAQASLEKLSEVRRIAEAEGDTRSFTHSYCTEAQAYKHLSQIAEDQGNMQEAELCLGKMANAIDTMIEFAVKYNLPEKKAVADFLKGNWHREKRDWMQAKSHFEEAVKNFANEEPGELGDWRWHLGEAQWHTGDKEEGLRNVMAGLEEIEVRKDVLGDRYDVWRSGAHMALAGMWREDDEQKSREYLKVAEDIIDSNPRLQHRKRQLLALKKELGIT